MTDERDKKEVKLEKALKSEEKNSRKIRFCFVQNFYQTMNEDSEDEEEIHHQQSSSSKPTTSPNGYSCTSSNSNTNDG